jgi:membrane protease YdiL (CAAX protease family)
VAAVSAPDADPASGDLTDAQRRGLRIEIAVVLAVTFGLSAYTALLRLVESVLLGLSGQTVALNPKRSPFDTIDLGLNLASLFQLVAWGLLAVYLLWRGGDGPQRIGLTRIRWRQDILGGVGLAMLIGIPGLALYQIARIIGLNASVEPAELNDTWWRIPVLLLLAFGNGWAEEVIVVGFLMTRLRQLKVNPWTALIVSSLLRGAYHLYQGFGAGLGNIAMGLVFGYVWQRTGRLWPLIVAHTLIDVVAFVGYSLLAGRLGWLL